jgi:hypothetical protein
MWIQSRSNLWVFHINLLDPAPPMAGRHNMRLFATGWRGGGVRG